MLHAFDHAVVAVRDLADATRSTEALLGLRPAWSGEHPEAGTAHALFRLANGSLELLAPEGSGAAGDALRADLEAHGEGQRALVFACDDADAFAAGLRARGVAAEEPRPCESRGGEALRRWRTVGFPGRGIALRAVEQTSEERSGSERVAPADSALEVIDHVVVTTPDLDAARALYGETLGLRLALDRTFEKRGIRILFFRLAGVTVEVAGPLEADTEQPDRFGGIAYRTPDADAARARLAGAGFDVSEVRAGAKPGTRVLTVRSGTCGVPTLVIEPAPRP